LALSLFIKTIFYRLRSTGSFLAMPQECYLDSLVRHPERRETVRLRAGEFLFREGDDADALYIVNSGVLRVVSGSTLYETVTAGGIIGEMAIVDEGMPRSASVIAGTSAELSKIDLAEFLALISSEPDFALVIMRVMARRLRVMNGRWRPPSTW
jgi:CRP/FNR family transcriptional regulator, cyclic AMP receptor protein